MGFSKIVEHLPSIHKALGSASVWGGERERTETDRTSINDTKVAESCLDAGPSSPVLT